MGAYCETILKHGFKLAGVLRLCSRCCPPLPSAWTRAREKGTCCSPSGMARSVMYGRRLPGFHKATIRTRCWFEMSRHKTQSQDVVTSASEHSTPHHLAPSIFAPSRSSALVRHRHSVKLKFSGGLGKHLEDQFQASWMMEAPLFSSAALNT